MAQLTAPVLSRLRQLTQHEGPPDEDECKRLVQELVQSHTSGLGAIDLFDEFLRHHNLHLLAEDQAFLAAVRSSRDPVHERMVLRSAISAAWGEDVAGYIQERQAVKSGKPTSTTTMRKIKAIAGHMSLARFKRLANAVLLVRHRYAITQLGKGRSYPIPNRSRILDEELTLIRDYTHGFMSYHNVNFTDAIADPIQREVEAWVKDEDGSAEVDHAPLRDYLGDNLQVRFHMLQFDAYGLLVQRKNWTSASPPLFVTPATSSHHGSDYIDSGPDGQQESVDGQILESRDDASEESDGNEGSGLVPVEKGRSLAMPLSPLSSPAARTVSADSEAGISILTTQPELHLEALQPVLTRTGSMWYSHSPTVVGSPELSKASLPSSPTTSHISPIAASNHLSDDNSTITDLEAEAEFNGGTSSEGESCATPSGQTVLPRLSDGIIQSNNGCAPLRLAATTGGAISAGWLHGTPIQLQNDAQRLYRSLMLIDPGSYSRAHVALCIGRWRCGSSPESTKWMYQARSSWFSSPNTIDSMDLDQILGETDLHQGRVKTKRFATSELSSVQPSNGPFDYIAIVVGQPRDQVADEKLDFNGLLRRVAEMDATTIPVLYATDCNLAQAQVAAVLRDIEGDVLLVATLHEYAGEPAVVHNFVRRYRLLETLLRRSKNCHDCDYRRQSLEVQMATTSGEIATMGACSGTRVEILAGTWISVVVGVAVIATVNERHCISSLRELSGQGRNWTPKYPQPAVILRSGDAGYIPAGVIYSVLAAEHCQVSYRIVWDDQDVVNSLAAVSGLQSTVLIPLIKMGLCPDPPLEALLRELQCPGEKFGRNHSALAAAQRLLRELTQVPSDSHAARAFKRPRLDMVEGDDVPHAGFPAD